VLIFAFLLASAEASPAQVLSPATGNKKSGSAPPGGCNCRCDLSHHDKFCGVNSKREKQTFQNECQLDCYNCTSDGGKKISHFL
jgi:hypothetical protein